MFGFDTVFPRLRKVDLTANDELLFALWLVTLSGVGVGDKLGRGSHSKISNIMSEAQIVARKVKEKWREGQRGWGGGVDVVPGHGAGFAFGYLTSAEGKGSESLARCLGQSCPGGKNPSPHCALASSAGEDCKGTLVLGRYITIESLHRGWLPSVSQWNRECRAAHSEKTRVEDPPAFQQVSPPLLKISTLELGWATLENRERPDCCC